MQALPALQVSPTQHEQLTGVARKFVSHAFFGTVLKQMRESPFKSELFSGGRGGETFASMLDFHLADRMAKSSGAKSSRRGLADSIVRHIENAQKETPRHELDPMKKNQTWMDLSLKARSNVTPTR
ncbi:MAG: rod-binding protein [Planctomycetota bacterium]|nr:rod-binding protein [Planctomycetota bacterium]